MRTITTWTAGFMLVACMAVPALGQAEQQAPHTLFTFLGLPPEPLHKLSDHLLSTLGAHHPHLEPKPHLKLLTDPANLESEVPAVKKAAELKQQEDFR